MKLLWFFAGLCSVISVFVLFTILDEAETIMQEIFAVALAMFIAVVPYVFVRACEKFRGESDKHG